MVARGALSWALRNKEDRPGKHQRRSPAETQRSRYTQPHAWGFPALCITYVCRVLSCIRNWGAGKAAAIAVQGRGAGALVEEGGSAQHQQIFRR